MRRALAYVVLAIAVIGVIAFIACGGDAPAQVVTNVPDGSTGTTDGASNPDACHACPLAGCVDLMNDPLNCGACGLDCGAHVCTNGLCTCPTIDGATQGNCDDGTGFGGTVCVDLMSDKDNCGECGLGCVGACVNGKCPRAIFVTSRQFSTNLAQTDAGITADPVAVADAYCQAAAKASGSAPRGTYKAWIAASANTSPNNRFPKSEVPFVTLAGDEVAASYAALVSGQLEHAIDQTEIGPLLDAGIAANRVMTAVTPDGLYAGSAFSCADWTLGGPDADTQGFSILAGEPEVTDAGWTATPAAQYNWSCNLQYALYCVQQF